MTTRPGYVWDSAVSEWVEIGQSAVVAPVAYQASAPSTPATGDIWIDSDDEVPSVDSTLYYRWTKTMSGGETSLSGTDNNSLSLRYTPGYESVFINGVLQARNLDYTATSGSTISGLTALASNDIVMVESIVAYSVGDTYTQSQMTSLLDAKSPVSTTGLVLLSTTTFTTQSTVSINSAFNANYDDYFISLKLTADATRSLTLRLRDGATDASGANYNYQLFEANSSTAVASRSTGQTSILFDTARTNEITFKINIGNPFKAAVTNFEFPTVVNYSAGSTTNVYLTTNAGTHTLTNSYTGFSIILPSGTITGTIKVYGYK